MRAFERRPAHERFVVTGKDLRHYKTPGPNPDLDGEDAAAPVGHPYVLHLVYKGLGDAQFVHDTCPRPRDVRYRQR